jgi:hypothetical protein
LVAGDLRLEVVVVGLLGQFGYHLHPGGLGDEHPVGVIGPAGIEDLAAPEPVREPGLDSLKVPANPGSDRDSTRIDRLAVLAVPVALGRATSKAEAGGE